MAILIDSEMDIVGYALFKVGDRQLLGCTCVGMRARYSRFFTTLIKRLSDSGDSPYCFDPLYITRQGGTVELKLGDH